MHFIVKKTVEQIINSGNDYVITVKANQPKLYHQIQKNILDSDSTSTHHDFEKVRDLQAGGYAYRITERRVSVFNNLEDISYSVGWFKEFGASRAFWYSRRQVL